MERITISLPHLEVFFLVFLRTLALMMTIPLFENRAVPVAFKAGLALALSVLLLPLVSVPGVAFPGDVVPFGIKVLGELMVGITMGFTVRLLFAAIQLAGQFMGFQMGFAVANVLDPQSSSQVSVIGMFYNIVAVLLFFAVDAHHWFLRALVESFQIVPLLHMHFDAALCSRMVELSARMFGMALRIGAPVMVALLLTSVGLGLMAKVVPQMNVFIMAFPLQIGIGFLIMGLSLPFLAVFLREGFDGMGRTMIDLLHAL
jgi:flagellar biosynthesis protein FliR